MRNQTGIHLRLRRIEYPASMADAAVAVAIFVHVQIHYFNLSAALLLEHRAILYFPAASWPPASSKPNHEQRGRPSNAGRTPGPASYHERVQIEPLRERDAAIK